MYGELPLFNRWKVAGNMLFQVEGHVSKRNHLGIEDHQIWCAFLFVLLSFLYFFHFLSFQTQVLEIISHLLAYAHWSLQPSHAFGFSVSRIRPRAMAQVNHPSCSTQKLVDCTWKTSGNMSVSP